MAGRRGARWILTDKLDDLYARIYESEADRDYWKNHSAELDASLNERENELDDVKRERLELAEALEYETKRLTAERDTWIKRYGILEYLLGGAPGASETGREAEAKE